jgi:hypothetical protein
MKLTRCYILGRFVNPDTGNPVNVHKGVRKGREDDHYFFIRSGVRVFIPANFRTTWKPAEQRLVV